MAATTLTTETVAQFLGSIGVNTHIGRSSTSYYNNQALIIQDMSYLGLTHARDILPGNPAGTSLAAFSTIAAAGIKFDLVIACGGTVSMPTTISNLNAFEAAYPGSIVAVEGANEVNGWPVTYNGQTGMTGAAALQSALYSAVKADSALAGVPVYNTTLGGGSETLFTQISQMAVTSADDVADHIYPQWSGGPAAYLAANIPWDDPLPSGKPFVITEGGYYSMPDQNYGVDQHVQAVYTLDFLLDAAKQGAQADYLYELLDDNSDPGDTNMEDHFGLFNADGSPKPVATAIHDFTTILSAAPVSGSAVNPTYTISGLPSTGNSMVLSKASGGSDLAVWAEPQIWNQSTDTEIAPPTVNATVSLGATYGLVEVFDPMLGTTPIETLSNVSSVTLALTDHPLIVEVEPDSAAPAPVTVASTQASYTASINNQTVLATAGSHSFILNGSGISLTATGGAETVTANGGGATIVTGTGNDSITLASTGNTVDMGAGTNNITDNAGSNTITITTAGQGWDHIYGNVFTDGDTIDLRKTLAATTWNGSTSTLQNYLRASAVDGGADMRLFVLNGSSATSVATFYGQGTATLATLEQHAVF